ncbi:hypothetical protein HPB47_013073 [Ixodes persulcatus]|uniref:Uncharacterized protein n=1 Tax=Ixodes persulcatus TaxID=34615 RepID=A0AC60NRT0_IXOPE|nr:hypothetical protein HPB47_013073 [Ixodes persulcatus]
MASAISSAGPVPHEQASSTILRTSQLVVVPTTVSHDSGSSLAQTSDMPPRKRRADEYQESPAATMEHQESITDEEAPFTQVIYKKTLKAGIPVLFKLHAPVAARSAQVLTTTKNARHHVNRNAQTAARAMYQPMQAVYENRRRMLLRKMSFFMANLLHGKLQLLIWMLSRQSTE